MSAALAFGMAWWFNADDCAAGGLKIGARARETSMRFLLPLLLLVACSDNSDKSDGTTGAVGSSDAGDGSSGDGGSDGGDDGGSDGGDDGGSDGGDGGSDGGDDGGSDGGDDGSAPTWSVMAVPSSGVVREGDEGGQLTVGCLFLVDGVLSDTEATAVVTVSPEEGVTLDGDTYTFETYGTYTVTCSGEVDGQSVSDATDVVVLTEVIAPELADAVETMASVRSAHHAVELANGADDASMVAAVEALAESSAAAAALAESPPAASFRSMPDGWWPEAADLTAGGITRNADDDALAAALTDWADALEALDAAIVALDPATVSESELTALEALDADVQTAGAALVALSPTAHGWLENGDAVANQLLGPALRVQAHTAALTEARLRIEAESILPPFGLGGLMMGMVNLGGIRGMYIEHVIVPVVEQLDLSINNLILMGLINYFAPGDGTVTIDYPMASSSFGYAVPGYDTWMYGSGFSSTPAMNKFIIVGVEWQEALGTIMDGCGIEEGDTVPEIVEDIDGCMETVNDAIENSQATPDAYLASSAFGEGVHLGPFPDVCGDGWVPVTIGILAINMETGGRTTEFTQLVCIP